MNVGNRTATHPAVATMATPARCGQATTARKSMHGKEASTRDAGSDDRRSGSESDKQ
jgi:hypothetical protein